MASLLSVVAGVATHLGQTAFTEVASFDVVAGGVDVVTGAADEVVEPPSPPPQAVNKIAAELTMTLSDGAFNWYPKLK